MKHTAGKQSSVELSGVASTQMYRSARTETYFAVKYVANKACPPVSRLYSYFTSFYFDFGGMYLIMKHAARNAYSPPMHQTAALTARYR